jgi:hypothetical protein
MLLSPPFSFAFTVDEHSDSSDVNSDGEVPAVVPAFVPAVVPTAQVEAGQDVVGDFPHVNGLDVDVPSDLGIATQVVGEELEGILENEARQLEKEVTSD